MKAITKNFNVTAIAANSSIIPSALGSVEWFQGTILIWLWLAMSDNAEHEEKEIATRHKRAVRQQEKTICKKRIAQQSAIAASPPRPNTAPCFF